MEVNVWDFKVFTYIIYSVVVSSNDDDDDDDDVEISISNETYYFTYINVHSGSSIEKNL